MLCENMLAKYDLTEFANSPFMKDV